MTIETKYNIGDEVWCNIYNGIKVKINSIKAIVFVSGSSMIEYGVHMNGLAWSRMENELFPTKEELIKSL